MIKYSVQCRNDHQFEGWFKDSASFDKQARRGDVECPRCGDTKITKAPMAPRINKSGTTNEKAEDRAREVAAMILEKAAEFREHVENNCDYVGGAFAEEARKIHYGEAEERGIYGEASEDDTRELEEEGIDVMPLPNVRRKSKGN